MFRNKYRKLSFYLFLLLIPVALITGFIAKYEPVFNIITTIATIGVMTGFFILKFLGGRTK